MRLAWWVAVSLGGTQGLVFGHAVAWVHVNRGKCRLNRKRPGMSHPTGLSTAVNGQASGRLSPDERLVFFGSDFVQPVWKGEAAATPG
jgi:hypothetical protein